MLDNHVPDFSLLASLSLSISLHDCAPAGQLLISWRAQATAVATLAIVHFFWLWFFVERSFVMPTACLAHCLLLSGFLLQASLSLSLSSRSRFSEVSFSLGLVQYYRAMRAFFEFDKQRGRILTFFSLCVSLLAPLQLFRLRELLFSRVCTITFLLSAIQRVEECALLRCFYIALGLSILFRP